MPRRFRGRVLARPRRVPRSEPGLGVGPEPVQQPQIDLVVRERQPVAGGHPRHRLGAQSVAHPRDQHLERLDRVGRRLVGPDLLDQALVRDPRRVQRQGRQQRRHPLARDGLALPAHPVEQGQGGGHARQDRSACRRRLGGRRTVWP